MVAVGLLFTRPWTMYVQITPKPEKVILPYFPCLGENRRGCHLGFSRKRAGLTSSTSSWVRVGLAWLLSGFMSNSIHSSTIFMLLCPLITPFVLYRAKFSIDYSCFCLFYRLLQSNYSDDVYSLICAYMGQGWFDFSCTLKKVRTKILSSEVRLY